MLISKKITATKSFTLFLHVIMWMCYFFLPVLMVSERNGRSFQLTPQQKEVWETYFFYSSNLISLILFYFNSEILIPKLLKKKGVIMYVVSVLITIILLIYLNYVAKLYVLKSDIPFQFTGISTIPMMIIFAISTCYRMLSDYQNDQEIRSEKENERLKSELSFLRSQISPHFMFNLLNSLVSLARKKSDILEPVLIKMSDLMRYMLYDSDDKQISIENEVRYLNSYIDLQKIRFGNYVKTNFIAENHNLYQKIEPMLLIPFVENAFKHGVGIVVDPTIDIYMANDEKSLYFKVSNKISAELSTQKDGSSGIGLTNVRRRLALLYPNQHELKIIQKDGIFTCELSLNFKQLPTISEKRPIGDLVSV